MFQTPTLAKQLAGLSALAAATFCGTPYGARTCTGPNCQNGQCSRPATVVIESAPSVAPVYVSGAPQFWTAGEQWVWVDIPADPEPEHIASPLENERDVKSEVEQLEEDTDDAAEPAEEAEAAAEGQEDQQAKASPAGGRDAKKATGAAKTQRVRMRATDAAALGLVPRATANRGGGSSGGWQPQAVASSVAYRTVTYGDPVVTYSCTGSGAATTAYRIQQQAFWGQPAYYRTRRVLFPNLFPRLRGLR